MDDLRVLSIQSHVVHGYVGNRCMVFPLQHFGVEVDIMNSVEFSNHVHYSHFSGQAFQAKEFTEQFEGLRKNDLHKAYSHVATGYCANASYLSAIFDAVKQLKEENPKLIYLCDPVMGDEGRLYVAANCAEIYREKLIPLADLITPNQFEMEVLTGIRITDEESALKGLRAMHDKGVRLVCLSSMDSEAAPNAIRSKKGLIEYSLKDDEHPKSSLVGYFSVSLTSSPTQSTCFRLRLPKLPSYFCGTGDLFSALLLARLAELESNSPSFRAAIRDRVELSAAAREELSNALGVAFRRAACAMYAVLRATLADAQRRVRVDDNSQQLSALLELRIVACRNQLTSPPDYDCVTVEQIHPATSSHD